MRIHSCIIAFLMFIRQHVAHRPGDVTSLMSLPPSSDLQQALADVCVFLVIFSARFSHEFVMCTFNGHASSLQS